MSDPKWFVGRLASPAFGSMVDCATSARTEFAFTSLAAARPIVQARGYNLARGIKLSAKTRSVYSIHNRWLRLLRAAVINWMLVLHVSMSVEQS